MGGSVGGHLRESVPVGSMCDEVSPGASLGRPWSLLRHRLMARNPCYVHAWCVNQVFVFTMPVYSLLLSLHFGNGRFRVG